MKRSNLFLFAVSTPVVALVYWANQDWWANASTVPKLLLPWWRQLLESGVIGALAGVVLVMGLGVLAHVWSGLSRRVPPP